MGCRKPYVRNCIMRIITSLWGTSRSLHQESQSLLRPALGADRSDPNSRFLVLRSSFAVSVYTLDGSSRIGAPIQIILNVFENTLAVLEDFDLDCCCFAFDVSTQKVGGRFVDNASADLSVRVIA